MLLPLLNSLHAKFFCNSHFSRLLHYCVGPVLLPPSSLYLFISALPKTGPYIAPEALPVLSWMYHLGSIPIYISQDNIWHFHRSMIQLAHLTTSVICQNSSQSFCANFLKIVVMGLCWWLFLSKCMYCVGSYWIAFYLIFFSDNFSTSAR